MKITNSVIRLDLDFSHFKDAVQNRVKKKGKAMVVLTCEDYKLDLIIRYKGNYIGFCVDDIEEATLILMDIMDKDTSIQKIGGGTAEEELKRVEDGNYTFSFEITANN